MVRFFYGARTQRDLFYLDLVEELGAQIPDFGFVPVLSEEAERRARAGFVHEAVDRYLGTGEMQDPQVYMCGPPPMIDAASEMLEEATASTTRTSSMTSSRRPPMPKPVAE